MESDSPHPAPLATVLVLTYNHGPYIEQCLDSLAQQQTNFPFEILVGEDCSTDETREIVAKIAARYPKLIRAFLNPQNLGAKRNSANLRNNARGTYIAYCEGDDYWHRPDKLQMQVDILRSRPEVSLVCSDVDVLLASNGRRYPSVMRRIGQWQNFPDDIAKAILTRNINISLCSVCLRRETLLAIHRDNPYECSDIHPMGDIQLFIEASRLGTILPIQESLATYRAIAESATRSKDPRKAFDFLLRSLPLFEHYVLKLGYDTEVMNRVRMTHIAGLIDLAMKSASPELREQARAIAEERHVRAVRITEHIALWCLQSGIRMKAGSVFLPLLSKLLKFPRRAMNLIRS